MVHPTFENQIKAGERAQQIMLERAVRTGYRRRECGELIEQAERKHENAAIGAKQLKYPVTELLGNGQPRATEYRSVLCLYNFAEGFS